MRYDPPLAPAPSRGPRPGEAMALSDIRAAAADARRRLDQIKESL